MRDSRLSKSASSRRRHQPAGMAVSVDNLFNSIPCTASIRHSCGSSFFTPGTGSLIVFHGDPLNPGHTEIWRMALLGFGGALIVCGVRESDPRCRFRVDAPWRCSHRDSPCAGRCTELSQTVTCIARSMNMTVRPHRHLSQTQTDTDNGRYAGATVFVCG